MIIFENEWIVDSKSLIEFLESLVVDDNKPHPVLMLHLPKILNDNEIVKDFSVYIYESLDYWAVNIEYIDILKYLMESNSFYLREDIIWDLCVKFWKRCCSQLGFRAIVVNVNEKFATAIEFAIIVKKKYVASVLIIMNSV